MSEQSNKPESVYDRIRREQRERAVKEQEAARSRAERLKDWSRQQHGQSEISKRFNRN